MLVVSRPWDPEPWAVRCVSGESDDGEIRGGEELRRAGQHIPQSLGLVCVQVSLVVERRVGVRDLDGRISRLDERLLDVDAHTVLAMEESSAT